MRCAAVSSSSAPQRARADSQAQSPTAAAAACVVATAAAAVIAVRVMLPVAFAAFVLDHHISANFPSDALQQLAVRHGRARLFGNGPQPLQLCCGTATK